MRFALPVALSLLFAASPLLATGTIHCRSQLQPDLEVYLAVGYAADASIAGARLVDGSQVLQTDDLPDSPRLGQAWLDNQDLRVVIVDSNHENVLARPTGRYTGSLRYRGRTYAISCRSDEEG